MGKRDRKLGITEGKLYPCPESPNCVSTQSIDKKHKIEPIKYQISLQEARDKIINIIKFLKRTKIISEKENYIHAEFRTRTFKFVDDVELYFDDLNKVIHFKSASRVGYSDMGVNRKRMETIRKLFFSN